MELWRRADNPWGQEVLIGISWDLMWAAVVVALLFLVGHALRNLGKGQFAVHVHHAFLAQFLDDLHFFAGQVSKGIVGINIM